MIYSNDFRVKPFQRPDLQEIDASFRPEGLSRKKAEAHLQKLLNRLQELQNMLYAEQKRSILVVLQGRDAAGKDGTIRHVFGPLNPQGVKVRSFKVPSRLEASHDFLWRCHAVAPARGEISIFNRSHYEDVLVVRVHNLVEESIWRERYRHIRAFESLMADSGTTILKFYLHIDRKEQLERFRQRLTEPAKNWKISDADYSERPLWNQYTEAFEDALEHCSTDEAPWFIIPANRKWFRNLAIAEILVEAMEEMQISYPKPGVDLEEIRAKYHEAARKQSLREDSKRT